MFVLDTNILSAMMSPQPVPAVRAWMNRHDKDLFFTTAISQAEILSGLAIMPEGRRRHELQALATVIFAEDFDGRVLQFDTTAAAAYADLFAARRSAGKPTAPMDLMIASIVRSHGASVVTRDTSGFDNCGITIINPWSDHP
jgi:predicted nucleic acid-binding protein